MKLVLFTLIVTFFSFSALAITPRIQIGESWGVTVPNGTTSDITAGVPQTLIGGGVSEKVSNDWVVFSDLVLAVPRAKFYPGFRPVVGVTRKFSTWALAGSMLYQWNPPFADGSKSSHLVGPTLAAVFPLQASGISFSFGAGYRAQFTGDKITHVFSFGPGMFFSF